MATDVSIHDPVQANGVTVTSDGEMKVSAAIPETIDVNLKSQDSAITTAPEESASIDQGQVAVVSTTGGTSIISAGTRLGLMIANLDPSKTLYLGFGVTPTVGSGFPVGPGASLTLPAGLTTDVEVKGIAASGTIQTAYVEIT